MSNIRNALATTAVLAVAALFASPVRAAIELGPPVSVFENDDKVTFQLPLGLVDEVFPEVLALQIDVSFDNPPLSAVDVQIHPDSPYSVAKAGSAAAQKQGVIDLSPPPGADPAAHVQRNTFLFIVSGPIEPGPLLSLSFDFSKHGTPQTEIGTLVRFQGFDEAAVEPEYDVPRYASIPLAIPEPGAVVLMLAGLGLLTGLKMRRRHDR